MDKFIKYFAAIDGTKDWSEIQPLFDNAFHPECVFVTADGEFTKQQWSEMAKGLAAKGVTASDFEVTGEDGDAFYYKLTINVDNDSMHLSAKGTLRDGQVVRVEPVDPTAYSELVERGK